MTRTEKKQQKKVMINWNGELEKDSNIEYILRDNPTDAWSPCRHPHWNWENVIYRVKPSPFNIWINSLVCSIRSRIKLQFSK